MTLEFASGAVSHLRLISNTHGQVGSNYGGRIQTSHTTMFRVGGHLAEMDGAMSLNDGDEVAIVGPNTPRGIHGLALLEIEARRMFVAPTDRRKLAAGILIMIAGIVINILSVIAGGSVYVGTLLLLGGSVAIWLYSREVSRVQEAVVTIHAHTPVPPVAAVTTEPLPVLGGGLHRASPGSSTMLSMSMMPVRLLPGIAWFFKGMALLCIVALVIETIAGFTYEGLRAIPLLSREWLVGGVAAATLWVASVWLLATAAFDAASAPIRHEHSDPALGSPPMG